MSFSKRIPEEVRIPPIIEAEGLLAEVLVYVLGRDLGGADDRPFEQGPYTLEGVSGGHRPGGTPSAVIRGLMACVVISDPEISGVSSV
jgi:hypothetical protein